VGISWAPSEREPKSGATAAQSIGPALSRPSSGGLLAVLCLPRSHRLSRPRKGFVGQGRAVAAAFPRVRQRSEQSRQFGHDHLRLANLILRPGLLSRHVSSAVGRLSDGEWCMRRLAIDRRQGSGRSGWTAPCRHRALQVLSGGHRQKSAHWRLSQKSLSCPLVWRFDPVLSGCRRSRS